jgi:hypothetical protein
MHAETRTRTEGSNTMPLNAESLQRLFAEQVGRQLEPEIAEPAAGLAGMLIDGLNTIDMEPMLLVEPTLAFEAAYRERTSQDEGTER